MEEIELIVKIPKDVYEDCWHLGSYELRQIISNGTPLPVVRSKDGGKEE